MNQLESQEEKPAGNLSAGAGVCRAPEREREERTLLNLKP
jgi:hypothetical protein